MKLSEVKSVLPGLQALHFLLPDEKQVPAHFHVTEIGLVSKHFIDCGGTVRKEELVSFQLWEANDYDHRLAPQKLEKIIALSESKLSINDDYEVEIEYQADTVGKYGVDFDGSHFLLVPKHTACLASDKCGTSVEKPVFANQCCAPDAGCC
ncbi:MAG: DUF6428 family protein [Chitinophagales bacterium]|nr:DUF6428 family protein [Chitinophagales bacterium]